MCDTGAGLVLTPANARRVSEKLSELRGAAMKVGQLLSMDAGDILPAELEDPLAFRLVAPHGDPARDAEPRQRDRVEGTKALVWLGRQTQDAAESGKAQPDLHRCR